jgi:hypothetical protein
MELIARHCRQARRSVTLSPLVAVCLVACSIVGLGEAPTGHNRHARGDQDVLSRHGQSGSDLCWIFWRWIRGPSGHARGGRTRSQ